jgi:hypothetical protein
MLDTRLCKHVFVGFMQACVCVCVCRCAFSRQLRLEMPLSSIMDMVTRVCNDTLEILLMSDAPAQEIQGTKQQRAFLSACQAQGFNFL